jgi:hypothetical protein
MRVIARQKHVFGILAGVFTIAFVFSATPSFAKPIEYMGYKKCIGCHEKQAADWKDAGMSTSVFEILLPGSRAEAKTEAGLDPNKDYTAEAECLTCHATGYGEPGGFKNYLETPGLAGVTCESCQGPGSKYWKVMAKNRHHYKKIDLIMKGYKKPSQAGCNKCHREGCPVGSDEYDFDREAGHSNYPLKGSH